MTGPYPGALASLARCTWSRMNQTTAAIDATAVRSLRARSVRRTAPSQWSPACHGEPPIDAGGRHAGKEDRRGKAVAGERDSLVDLGITAGRERDDRRHRRWCPGAGDDGLSVGDRVRPLGSACREDQAVHVHLQAPICEEVDRARVEAPREATGRNAEQHLVHVGCRQASQLVIEDLAATRIRGGHGRDGNDRRQGGGEGQESQESRGSHQRAPHRLGLSSIGFAAGYGSAGGCGPGKTEAPPKRGLHVLPDSLTARASFTSGFPLYPYPNLPMTLRPVVNRCANSPSRINPCSTGVNGLALRILYGANDRPLGRVEAPIHAQEPLVPMAIDSMTTGSTGTPWSPFVRT